MPTKQASAIECKKTNRRIEPSWPAQLFGRDLLKVTKQYVRRGIRASERDTEPAQQRAEEGVEHAGASKRQTECRVDAGQPRERSDRQHRRDGEGGIGAHLDCLAVGHPQPYGREAHKKAS